MKVDVYRDGTLWLTKQDPAKPAIWPRIQQAAIAGRTLGIQPVAVPPPPPPAATFGVADEFQGRGIMLGSNPDVWDQARQLAKDGHVEVVAVLPGTAATFPCGVVTWVPPELEPHPGMIHQAEGPGEWAEAISHMPAGIALNSWEYGTFPTGCVALVEAYYNEGWGLNFDEFYNYMAQGAQGVVPLCGGWSSTGRSDAEAARIYNSLATWGPGFPGFWMFAGESYLTDESVAVLKAWRKR